MAGVSKNNLMLAANVRNLALTKIQAALNGDDEEFKKALLLKLSGSILPKLNEHTGTDGEPIKFNIINYGDNSSPLIQPKEVSVASDESDGRGDKEGDNSVEQA